jgi:nucleotide-binding universal stress UspA family protein
MNMTNSEAYRPRAILLATDLGPRSDRALDRALLLAQAWQAHLLALTVLESNDAVGGPQAARQRAEQRLRADLEAVDLPLSARVAQGPVVATVLQVAQAEGSDLIVTGVARREDLARMVLGSSVDALARSAPRPLLVVRERARKPYQRVLVATDFSSVSHYALETAAAWFPDAQFTLFHAYGNPYPTLGGMDAAQARAAGHAHAERTVQGFLQTAQLPDAVRASLRVHLAFGDAGLLLHEHGLSHPSDLVVLGTARRVGMPRLFLGSVAQRILEIAENDVLVVPAR